VIRTVKGFQVLHRIGAGLAGFLSIHMKQGGNSVKLKGQTAIVTGAGNGIGKAVAMAMAREGANLVLVDLNGESASAVASEIISAGGYAIAEKADVCDSVRINEIVNRTINELEKIDIVVNNAGGSARLIGKVTPFAESCQSTWEWVIRLNLIAPMIMNRAVVPHMIQRRRGKIVNLGSIAGVNGLPNLVDYSAAKGGVISMTRALAIELGPYGINVNCVSPGAIESRPGQPNTFLNRSGQPWEVAELILFLASGDSDFITGQNYLIDGGRSLSSKC